jgi:hypothetical protein
MFGFLKRSRDGAAILSLPFRMPSMDQAILAERLEQAEHHVAKGVRCIASQRTVVADLERNGLDTTQGVTRSVPTYAGAAHRRSRRAQERA